MSGTANDKKWQWVIKSGTMSDKEWQQVITSGMSDKEWLQVIQQVKTCDNKWKWVWASDSSGTTNENSTVDFKEGMVAILSITKNNILLLHGMDDCN